MSSLDSLMSRFYAAEGKSVRITTDSPVKIRIKEVAGGTSTPTVTFSSSMSVLTIVDSDGTSTAMDMSATYTTMGLLVDKINSTVGFQAKLLDCLRTDASSATMESDAAITVANVDGEMVYDCHALTDVVNTVSGDAEFTYRLTYDRGINNNKPKGSHRVKLTQVLMAVTVGGAEADGVKIYEWNAANKTETLIWTGATAVATATTYTFDDLTPGEGNDLIVRIADTTSITDNAANFVNIEYTRE